MLRNLLLLSVLLATLCGGPVHAGSDLKPWTGGLLNARGVIDALAAGRLDVGPLDSYSFDLLRHLEPGYAAQLRAIASTDPTASLAFVATAPLGDQELAWLCETFVEAGATPDLAVPRERLLIAGLAVPVRAAVRDFRAIDMRTRH